MSGGTPLTVWIKTVATVAIWTAVVVSVHLWWVRMRVPDRGLSLALSFTAVQIATIAVLVVALFFRKSLVARRAKRSRAISDEIATALALDLAGKDQLRNLRALTSRSRRDVEAQIQAMLATLRGSSRERLVRLAADLGFGDAASAERIERVFAEASTGNLLERAVAAEQLEPDAARLAAVQLPRALRSSDPARLMFALELIAAWRKALPLADVEPLLRHGNAEVRARAVRALPYAGVSHSISAIRNALADPDARVQVAAAETASKLRLEGAAEDLIGTVRNGSVEVALAAAFAVAALPGGPARLQALVDSGDAGAPAAFEALEKAALGRLQLA